METNEEDLETKTLLRAYYAEHDHISPLAVDTAVAAFGLRDVEGRVAELLDHELTSRSVDDADGGSLRFTTGDVAFAITLHPGEIDVTVTPRPEQLTVETTTTVQPIPFDDAGGGSISCHGVLRVRALYSTGAVVTDPFRVVGR